MNREGQRLVCVGHRGAAGHAADNTVESFRLATEFGVDFIETDLRMTADGEIVLCHDLTVSAAGFDVTVAKTTLRRLREFCELRSDPIVTLRELLALIDGSGTGVMLELKVAGIIEQVYETVQRSNFANAVIYSSFRHDEILRLRKAVPAAQTLALLEAAPVGRSRFATDACATYAGIHFELADATFITALHNSGVKVFVYTVNHNQDIQRMIASQVDGIISDYPDRVVKCRNAA